jgi:hypothetical protein
MYENLPILIVADWSHVSKELLEKEIFGSMEKLSLHYWLDQIKNAYKPGFLDKKLIKSFYFTNNKNVLSPSILEKRDYGNHHAQIFI